MVCQQNNEILSGGGQNKFVSCDVMAGGGGAAGPAPDVRHQPAGAVLAEIQNNILIPCRTLLEPEDSWFSGIDSLAVCIRFRVRIPGSCTFCQNVLYAHVRAYNG